VELRVVVRVHVDEAGGDDAAVGVDRAGRRFRHAADARDASVAHGDVGRVRRHAGAVGDPSAAHHEVEAHFEALRPTRASSIP
jgi:hypothetical protein